MAPKNVDSRALYLVIRREADERTPERWRILLGREQVDRARRSLGLPAGTSHHDRRLLCVAPGTADFSRESDARARIARLAELGVESEAQRIPSTVTPRPKPWVAQLGVGGFTEHVGRYHSAQEAEDAGIAAWRAHVADIPMAPPEPYILRPGVLETGWDVLERERKRIGGCT
jgi:hypothetical protein